MTARKRQRGVDITASRAFSNYRPPEDLTVSQWAEKRRILSRESSAEAGRWRNERTPYMTEIMDSFTDSRVREIAVVAMSQTGKSEVELNDIGYIIDQDPASIIYVQPTLDDAKKFSKLRVAPMIRDSPTLRKKVSDVKSRDSGNTVLQKSFPGGMLTMVGSLSASALASTPARYVIGDEVDRWALSAGSEGDPYALAAARTTTFYNSKIVAVSTPTIKGYSRIEKLFNGGTQEHWCSRCPDCGEYTKIVFDDIKFEHEASKVGKTKIYKVLSILWCCPHCGCVHTETDMRKQPAKWIADNPDAIELGRRSFWLSAFSSPWRSWTEIVQTFLESKNDPEKLKVFFNTILGELWEDRGDLEDEDTMLARREGYGTREDGSPIELPEGVLVLTCGVDTQDDRLEYEVVGHGHYGETWGIKKGVIMGDPNDDAVWNRLDDVIDRVYHFKDGSGLVLSIICVDSGGHKTQSVYKQCRARTNRRVFAIKGAGGDGVPYTKPPSKVKIVVKGRTIGETWLYSIGVDAGKADIMSNLKVQEAGAKFCHFPIGEERGYDLAYFNGLLSEKLVMKTDSGRTRWAWVKLIGHERNEALDCRNYALAGFRILDPDLDAVEKRLREVKDKPATNKNETKQKRRGAIKRNADANDW
ncbi:MAG: phage terminase large subunit family protein [Oscillospiraceae bacterium]